MMYNKSRNIIMSNDFNTTQTYNFSLPSLCGKVIHQLNLFLKNKKTQKVVRNHIITYVRW
jgi:hypothetical protein